MKIRNVILSEPHWFGDKVVSAKNGTTIEASQLGITVWREGNEFGSFFPWGKVSKCDLERKGDDDKLDEKRGRRAR